MSKPLVNDLIDNFPNGYNPRDKQFELLSKIQTALNSDKKHIMICAPTGIGKSFISATLANASEEPCAGYKDYINSYRAFLDGNEEEAERYPNYGSAVLTVTKQLQDQYIKDFKDISLMKGKTNYICDVDNDYDVEDAPCNESTQLMRECWNCNRCPYYEARNHAILDKFGVFNYNVFLNLPAHVRKKQFIICDEASELEDTLVDIFSFELTYEKIDKVLEKKIPRLKLKSSETEEADGYDWLTGLETKICDKIVEYKKILEDKTNKQYNKARYRVKTLRRWLAEIRQVLDNWCPRVSDPNLTEYVVEPIEPTQFKPDIDEGVKFAPLRVNKLSRYLFDHAVKVIYLSATIIDHKKELKDLGVGKDDYVYIETGSVFDPKKSPIRTSGKYPLSYKLFNDNIPKVLDMAEAVLKKHKDDKGIIHTVNFRISKAVKDRFGDDRLIFREGGATNKMILEEHTESDEATVLVSPSMSHGVDLKGDLGKFQIIMKIPYLPIGDKRIKKLCDTDYQWYINKTLSSLVQACGRCTRTEDDEAVTYILDGGIQKLLSAHRHRLPLYFKERLHTKTKK